MNPMNHSNHPRNRFWWRFKLCETTTTTASPVLQFWPLSFPPLDYR